MEVCWFCQQSINTRSTATDRHHLICRRFFKAYPGENPDTGNIVYACVEHHRRWHKEFDNPHLSLDDFMAYMWSLDFGKGIYARRAKAA